MYTSHMERQSELTPIDIKTHQESVKGAVPSEKTAAEYAVRLDSITIPGEQPVELHRGQVIATAQEYAIDDFEKKGDNINILLVNKETQKPLVIPVSKLEAVKNIEDLELLSAKEQLRTTVEQIKEGTTKKSAGMLEQSTRRLKQYTEQLENLSKKYPDNSEIKEFVDTAQKAFLNAKHLKELQVMWDDSKKRPLGTKMIDDEIARVYDLLQSKIQETNESTPITETVQPTTEVKDYWTVSRTDTVYDTKKEESIPEISKVEEQETTKDQQEEIKTVAETPVVEAEEKNEIPVTIEKEKTPLELVTDARNRYLKLYADDFADSAVRRGLLNLGHMTGLLKKDSKSFLGKKTKAAKDHYENLKNELNRTFFQEKTDQLKAKGKSDNEVAAIIKRYHSFSGALELLEQESEILKQAREKVFKSKTQESLKKNFAWYLNLKPTQKKLVGVTLSVGIGAAVGTFTGGASIAASIAARLARMGAGMGMGSLTAIVGTKVEQLWRKKTGGSYEDRLEDLKKRYVSGDLTPAAYQEEKEGLELLENRVKTVKTAAAMGVGFGTALGTGAAIHALETPNVPDIPQTPETHTIPETSDMTDIPVDQESAIALEPTSTSAESVLNSTEQLHDFNKLSPDAVAKPGESIWKIVERQIEHDPKLAQTLGVHEHPTVPDLVKVLRGFGYIANEGDVRIADFNNTAYELTVHNGVPVINEYHNGQFVEMRTLTTGTEQGSTEPYEVFHPSERLTATPQ